MEGSAVSSTPRVARWWPTSPVAAEDAEWLVEHLRQHGEPYIIRDIEYLTKKVSKACTFTLVVGGRSVVLYLDLNPAYRRSEGDGVFGEVNGERWRLTFSAPNITYEFAKTAKFRFFGDHAAAVRDFIFLKLMAA